MIFIHNETGELYELLILSLDDSNNETFKKDNRPVYRLKEITMMGITSVKAASMSDFARMFTLIG